MRCFTAIAVVLATLVASPAAAQQLPPDTALTAREWARYSAERRDPFVAGALEFVLPTLGFAYAGDWIEGALFFVGSAAGVYIADRMSDTDEGYAGYSTLVWGTAAAFRVIAMDQAAAEASEANSAILRRLMLGYAPANGGRMRAGLIFTF